jgi:hypothetical protein
MIQINNTTELFLNKIDTPLILKEGIRKKQKKKEGEASNNNNIIQYDVNKKKKKKEIYSKQLN